MSPCAHNTRFAAWNGSIQDQTGHLFKKCELWDETLSLNLGGNGSTPHNPTFQMPKAHLPESLKVPVLYPLLAYTLADTQYRTSAQTPARDWEAAAAYLEHGHMAQWEGPPPSAGPAQRACHSSGLPVPSKALVTYKTHK